MPTGRCVSRLSFPEGARDRATQQRGATGAFGNSVRSTYRAAVSDARACPGVTVACCRTKRDAVHRGLWHHAGEWSLGKCRAPKPSRWQPRVSRRRGGEVARARVDRSCKCFFARVSVSSLGSVATTSLGVARVVDTRANGTAPCSTAALTHTRLRQIAIRYSEYRNDEVSCGSSIVAAQSGSPSLVSPHCSPDIRASRVRTGTRARGKHRYRSAGTGSCITPLAQQRCAQRGDDGNEWKGADFPGREVACARDTYPSDGRNRSNRQ